MWFELVVNVGDGDTVNPRSIHRKQHPPKNSIPRKLLSWCYDVLSVSGDGISVCSLSSIAS